MYRRLSWEQVLLRSGQRRLQTPFAVNGLLSAYVTQYVPSPGAMFAAFWRKAVPARAVVPANDTLALMWSSPSQVVGPVLLPQHPRLPELQSAWCLRWGHSCEYQPHTFFDNVDDPRAPVVSPGRP